MSEKSVKEVNAVLLLDGAARFNHFIKQVVDSEIAWGLWDDGWALMETDNGTSVFPLWPAEEYAELNRLGDWAHYQPKSIALEDLLEQMLPDFAESNILPGIFPTPTGSGVTPTAEELSSHLRDYDAENF